MIPDRPDIFLEGMHVVFIGSSMLCLIEAFITGWRLFTSKKAAKKQESKAS
ncbi:hypothetical protein [Niallia sp. 03133]|uniref:hypothetical protein n=1 Tax=Niallia sp. 03133 TaxID=3458060 RepID=UPI00404490F0